MQKKKKTTNKSVFKVAKNRLSFAFHKKKGFLKTNKHIEILYLEGEEPVKKKVRIKKPTIYASATIGVLAIFLFFFSLSNNVEVIHSKTVQFLAGLGIYTEEVRSIEIESNDYDNPGSWKIVKSAKWISSNTAQITFDVSSVLKETNANTKDVILVIDNSGSMRGDKLNKAISDSKELADVLFSSGNNRMAIITFASESSVLSNFTNNKQDIISALDSIDANGSTNYNAGLNRVNEIMNGYVISNNRDLVVLFLTDGYPNVETRNEIATYQVLKDKYPFMIINGIQYEMGEEIVQEIIQISDNQWVANQATLNNALLEASITPLRYEEFLVTDYISEYFTISSLSDIKVDKGTVSLTEESGRKKVVWDLGNALASGSTALMTINVTFIDSPFTEEGFAPTNERETVVYKLQRESEKTVNSSDTPVLSTYKTIYYSVNAPTGCTITNPPSENHYVFEEVSLNPNNYSCDGYLFQGWQIQEGEDDITYINSDTILMPIHDIHLNATWTKQQVVKSMEGEIHEKATLYKIMEQEAANGTYAEEYTGSHQDSYNAALSTKKVYRWKASNQTQADAVNNRNNVLFADHCWQIIRTNDTGGVRLLYNGPTYDGTCSTTRGSNHPGYTTYSGNQWYMTNYNYYYGTDYTYDPVTKIFQLTGEIEQLRYNSSTKDRILGKYTCCSTSATATCSTLYYIDKIVSNTTARATGITSIPYYHVGNRNYNTSSAAMAQFGYMYNKNYETGSKTIANTESVLAMRNSYYATNSYFADDFTWDGSTYSLNNPFQYTSDMDMSSIVGKYTFFNTTATTTAATIYYVMSYNSQNNTYSVVLNNGEELNTIPTTYSYGSTYVDNQDGTYTIDNPTTFNPTEYSNHQSGLTGKYICKNASNGTCSDLHYILGVDDYHYAYLEVNKPIKFGKGVVYENGQYTLTDTQTSWNYLSNGLGLSNLHYTCWDETGVCSEVNYIFYIKTRTSTFYEFYIYYLKLDDGSDMEQAIHNMFRADDVNTYSSEAKQAVDEWYERYMLSYSNYLEDAIYCNNRNISRIISFNPNGGATRDTENLYFEKGFYCSDEHDQFSVSNPKARLTYPVGLLAEGEITSMYLRKAGADYWTMTPNAYIESILMINTVTSSGAINGQGTGNNRTIRPVISLKPGIEYVDGDGSRENPYTLEGD